MICFPLFSFSSCLIKITATLVGTYFYPPLRDTVLFLHFVDYLSLVSLLWWLCGYTIAHSRTRLQLRNYLCYTIGLATVLLLFAVLGYNAKAITIPHSLVPIYRALFMTTDEKEDKSRNK